MIVVTRVVAVHLAGMQVVVHLLHPLVVIDVRPLTIFAYTPILVRATTPVWIIVWITTVAVTIVVAVAAIARPIIICHQQARHP
jgi:hypothetical protein